MFLDDVIVKVQSEQITVEYQGGANREFLTDWRLFLNMYAEEFSAQLRANTGLIPCFKQSKRTPVGGFHTGLGSMAFTSGESKIFEAYLGANSQVSKIEVKKDFKFDDLVVEFKKYLGIKISFITVVGDVTVYRIDSTDAIRDVYVWPITLSQRIPLNWNTLFQISWSAASYGGVKVNPPARQEEVSMFTLLYADFSEKAKEFVGTPEQLKLGETIRYVISKPHGLPVIEILGEDGLVKYTGTVSIN